MFLLLIYILIPKLISNLSIDENLSVPYHIHTFDSQQSYTFISSSSIYSYFSIVNQTQLYLIQSIDREDFCSKNYCSCLTICLIQLKILSKFENEIFDLNLTINDLNDNQHRFPFDEIQLNIPEHLSKTQRQCYKIPSIIDEDLFETNQIEYRLIGHDQYRFEIHHQIESNSLCLNIRNQSLDREECHQYEQLWILAQDQLKQQATMKILVQVLDINDHSPTFLTNHTILHVNETFSGRLICLEAFDPDENENGQIIYSFEYVEINLKNSFILNNQTGCIDVIQPLVLTSIDDRLLLTIRAQDLASKMSSTLPSYHLLELFIEEINDHWPTIEVKRWKLPIEFLKNNSIIQIKENLVENLAIISIEDLDRGIFGEIQLDFIVHSIYAIHQQAFSIQTISNNNKHWKFQLEHSLDYELETLISIDFNAIDGGGLLTRFSLKIFIENQNDEQPLFEQDYYYFILNIQSTNSTTLIGQVHANDRDTTDDNLRYSFESFLFQIDSQTGQIYLRQTLAIDMIDQILTFNINVTDGKYSSQTNVSILIQGYNHCPYFEQDHYFIEIDENTPIRTIIGQIVARDEDSSLTSRGILTYSVRSITSYSEYYFHINSQGEIVVSRLTDAEEQQIHELFIIVKDHGVPSLINQTKLTIQINDINEYCPRLINQTSDLPHLFLNRTSLSSHLSAFDNDISDQSNIYFQFYSSFSSHLFQLNSNGLVIFKEFPSKFPLLIELTFTMSDQFFPQPCVIKERLVIIIAQTYNECSNLFEQYKNSSLKSISKTNLKINERIHRDLIFIFSFCILILFIGILYFICCDKRQRKRSITTKTFYIINSSSVIDGQIRYTQHSSISRSSSCTPSII